MIDKCFCWTQEIGYAVRWFGVCARCADSDSQTAIEIKLPVLGEIAVIQEIDFIRISTAHRPDMICLFICVLISDISDASVDDDIWRDERAPHIEQFSTYFDGHKILMKCVCVCICLGGHKKYAMRICKPIQMIKRRVLIYDDDWVSSTTTSTSLQNALGEVKVA